MDNPSIKLKNARVSLVEPTRWSRIRRKRRDTEWIGDLCRVASTRPLAGVSPVERFKETNPNLRAERTFIRQATKLLENDPNLLADWQRYASQKRQSPKPMLEQARNLTLWIAEDGKRHDLQSFKSVPQATAWFIWIETVWLTDRRGLTGRPRRRLHRIRSAIGRALRTFLEIVLEIFSAF